MMPTVAREIDAFGGVANSSSDYDQAFHEGYDKALSLAEPIAENADALIEELIKLVEDMLDGNRRLETWIADARRIVISAKHRRAQ